MTVSNIYCSLSQLQVFFDTREIAQVSADDDSGGLSTATIETILDAAGSWMDSVIGYRATILAGQVPPLLTRLVAAKAMKMCLLRRGKTSEAVNADAREADDWADKLTKGLVVIPTYAPPAPELIQSSSGSPQVSRFDRLPFGDRSLGQGVNQSTGQNNG